QGQRQQNLHTTDTRLRRGEGHPLGFRLVGLVVGRNRLDHSSLYRLAQGAAVAAAAQRWHHVQQAGIAVQVLVTQQQLVHGNVGSDRQAAGLGVRQHVNGPGAAQAAEMRAYSGLLDQQQVPPQRYGLGAFGNPDQAQEGSSRPLMGDAALGQRRVHWREDHRQVEALGIFQRPAQDAIALHVRQALGEGDAASITQGHQLAQVFAIQATGQRTQGEYPGLASALGAVQDQLGYRRGIQHRAAVGRAAQAGDTADGGGAGFAGDAALAAEAGFAQADVQVHQAG